MKGCLKNSTPPYSPEPSCPSTPCDPSSSRPRLQKTVSFCGEEEVEVYEADEWDRSPAPVTPKLSYEDVLELKRLRLSLPRTAPPPTARHPFTTSLPTAYTAAASSSCTASNFPYSRFANQPSQTPSKWKNRGTAPLPSADLDPDILPYLDAVPIRLLPLLDTPEPTDPPSPQLLAHTEPLTRSASSQGSPPSPSVRTPSPTPSPKASLASTSSVSPPPLPSLPTAAPATSSPARRAFAFPFVPLLPVQTTPAPSPEPVRLPSPPQRRVNMVFVPLFTTPAPTLPAPLLPEATPLIPQLESAEPSALNTSPSEVDEESEKELAPTPTLAPIAELSPSLATPTISSPPEGPSDAYADLDTDGEEVYSDLPARALSPTDLSTPALSSASESDTDEHDTDGDDAGCTSRAARASAHAHAQLRAHSQPALAEYEYFAARLEASSAGQTPPLSSTFPNAHPHAHRCPRTLGLQGESVGLEPKTMEMGVPASIAALRKVTLAALPSPPLVPPSPFSLYPPTVDATGGRSPFVPMEVARGEGEVVGLGVVEKNGVALGREAGVDVELAKLAIGETPGGGGESAQ